MVDLKLPETDLPVSVLGKTYTLDLTDFKGVKAIQGLPCMAGHAIPTEALMEIYIPEMDAVLNQLLQEPVDFGAMPKNKRYFYTKALLVKLHNLITEKQAEYLDLEYPLTKNMLEISRNLAEARKDGKPENP